jgi:glycosyltransferase involved in cell wall biosynthesis
MMHFNRLNKTEWVPHGVNEELLKYSKFDERYKNWIVFFGKMNYQPNVDAVIWFIENVLPDINKNLIFGVVGAYPPKKLLKLKEKCDNIEITGFVGDPYIILKSALCVVAPMQTGGGIQNKILESMALGTVNIVSSLAAKPIGGRNAQDFIIEDNPKKIAEIINDIYNDPQKYEHIRKSSREFIRNNFTWSIYERKLLSIIDKVLSHKKS